MRAAALVVATTFSLGAHGQTATRTGQFSSMPGYGYQIDANWSASVGSFEFIETEQDRYGISPVLGPVGSISISVQLVATEPTQFQNIDAWAFSSDIRIELIDLATGQPAIPPLLFTNPAHPVDASAGGTPGVQFVPSLTLPPGSIRFSNSTFYTSTMVTDGNGHPLSSSPSPTVEGAFTTNFGAGHFAVPSNDPNCASVSCMIPGEDQIMVAGPSFSFNVSVVPEPRQWSLMASGLALLALIGRRCGMGRRAD